MDPAGRDRQAAEKTLPVFPPPSDTPLSDDPGTTIRQVAPADLLPDLAPQAYVAWL